MHISKWAKLLFQDVLLKFFINKRLVGRTTSIFNEQSSAKAQGHDMFVGKAFHVIMCAVNASASIKDLRPIRITGDALHE
jgi:hypothetical protein